MPKRNVSDIAIAIIINNDCSSLKSGYALSLSFLANTLPKE